MKTSQNWLVRICNGSFYDHSSAYNKRHYLFTKEIIKFEICSDVKKPSFWVVSGPRKSDFLKILASKYFADPPNSRTYSSLINGGHHNGVKFIDFKDNSGIEKCHMAARYEAYSFRGEMDSTDDVNSVLNYVSGANNYNRSTNSNEREGLAEEILAEFKLSHCHQKWINSLSNGQMRRARIAKAIHGTPQLLVIDDPFLGLDPNAALLVSGAIRDLATKLNISVVLGLRPIEAIPSWISKLALVDDSGLCFVDENLSDKRDLYALNTKGPRNGDPSEFPLEHHEISPPDPNKAFIEFVNASVVYKNVPILSNFNWKVEKGSKWRILGVNGSGKTTILSLITAEHPQSWKSCLRINGVTRRTGSGVNYFDINNQIGVSSPELHAIVPSRISFITVIMNGLVRDVGNSNLRILYKCSTLPSHAQKIMQHFTREIQQFRDVPFCELSVSSQKLALFLRAIIKNPDLLILDEAFSGMDPLMINKCHLYIEHHLEETTILAVGHLDWEVPTHNYILQLNGDSANSCKFFSTSEQAHN